MFLVSVVALSLFVPGSVAASGEPERYAGRPLAEALQLLQLRGLRIVYSSAVVSAEMRVQHEPRSAEAERALVELLRPHGLAVKPGPGGVLQVVRAPRPQAKPAAGDARPASTAAPPSVGDMPPAYDEAVLVLASADAHRESGVAAQSSLDRELMQARAATLAGDPLYAMHGLPRVASSDDFRGEFSVRGSPYRHVGIVVDGVATPLMRHAAIGAGDTASMTMIAPDAIERATLQAGAYPRRVGDSIGGQVAMTLREGSRQRTTVSGAFAGVAAAVVAEGPLRAPTSATAEAARGSWLVSARQSVLDFPTTSFGAEYGGMGFAFRDLQAKLAYDVTATQQVSATVIAGQTNAEHGNDSAPHGMLDGVHRAGLVTAAWRSTLGPATAVTQRVHAVTSHVTNTRAGHAVAGRQRDVGYRGEIAHAWSRVLLDAGADLQRKTYQWTETPDGWMAASGSAWQHAAYVHAAWTPRPGLTLASGMRAGASTRASSRAVSPWLLTEWTWQPGWTLTASSGLGHQFADSGEDAADSPAAVERARYIDVGVKRTFASGFSVQGTMFHRRERDVRDGPLNTLNGRAHGAELQIARTAIAGLSGSASYSFGVARYADTLTGERFRADFDQRHAVNLLTAYRWPHVTAAAVFRAGTNFPIPGYLRVSHATLLAGNQRNIVPRPPYARLDLQATRSFAVAGRRMTMYVELLNALNHANYGPADGVLLRTGEAVGFTETLLPRFLTGGFRIDF